MNNYISGLIAKILSNEASEEEIAEVETYLHNNPDDSQRFEMLRKIWPVNHHSTIKESDFRNREENERLSRIMSRAIEERQNANADNKSNGNKIISIKRFSRTLLKYAAIIVVSVASLLFIIKNNSVVKPVRQENNQEITAENGTRKRVLLPDGSTVLLNGGSRIIFATNFEGKTREVTLIGEAFFDVVKQPQRPFIVHASNVINIKVLGTAFNVKSYPDEDAIETTLIRGLIEINRQDAKQEKSILLHPNEKITMPRCGDCLPAKKINSTTGAGNSQLGKIISLDSSFKENDWTETAWIHNRLEFRKNSLRDIAKKFERWYNVKIFISDDSLASIKFNGSFENETLEQALMALQKTIPFKFKINNNEVFINVP